MARQTSAVEFVVEEFISEIYLDCNVSTEKTDKILEIVHKARELFKEQIIHAATYGANAESPESYYNSLYPNVS